MMQEKATSNRGRGWLLVAVVAGLVLLSGIYPLVAEPENRDFGATIIGLGALALGMSAGPLRHGEPATWMAMWIFPAALVLIGVVLSDATFRIVFIVFGAVAGLGLFWSRSAILARTGKP